VIAGVSVHGMIPSTADHGRSRPAARSLAHAVGWPVAEGGSGKLTDAMAAAVVAAGGEVRTGSCAVARRAARPPAQCYSTVTPRALIELAGDRLPHGYRRRLAHFRYGPASARSTGL